MWAQPQGRKVSAISIRVTISDLTWEDNGLEISCRAENAFTRQKGRLLTGVYRLDVQYDPRIRFHPLNGNDCSGAESGSCDVKEGGRIHVMCTAHANPSVTTVNWEGSYSAVLHVTARRDHESFKCLAYNGRNSGSETLRVNVINPPNKPTITVEPRLYEGNQHTASCSVAGGNPPADSLNLTCHGQSKTAQRQSHDVIVTNVTFTVERDETICTCTAYGQRNTGWPSPVSTVITRTIYRPPSTPTITRVPSSPRMQAYKERDTPILGCKSSDPGNPPATYQWVQPSGWKGSVDQLSRMTITNLTWEDNGLEISCRAENAFTTQKRKLLTGVYRLDVQFEPRISFQPLHGNDCSVAESGSCDVKEGGRIHVKCTAHANPNVTTVNWEVSSSAVLNVTARRDHKSFECLANNERKTGSKTFHVNVIYHPGSPELSLAPMGREVIDNSVKENSNVTFTCTGKSRPKPSLRLQRVDTDRATYLVSTAQTPKEEDVTVITYNLPSAKCEDAGRYQCVVSDNEKLTSQADLFVRCSPRMRNDASPRPPYVTYRGLPEQLNYHLTAYPVPRIVITPTEVISKNPGVRSDEKDKFTANCTAEREASYLVVCTVYIQDAMADDVGVYSASVTNSEGAMDTLIFSLFVQGWKAYSHPPPRRQWEMHEYGAMNPKQQSGHSVATNRDSNPTTSLLTICQVALVVTICQVGATDRSRLPPLQRPYPWRRTATSAQTLLQPRDQTCSVHTTHSSRPLLQKKGLPCMTSAQMKQTSVWTPETRLKTSTLSLPNPRALQWSLPSTIIVCRLRTPEVEIHRCGICRVKHSTSLGVRPTMNVPSENYDKCDTELESTNYSYCFNDSTSATLTPSSEKTISCFSSTSTVHIH